MLLRIKTIMLFNNHNKFQSKIKTAKGFSLLESIIAIVILGVLASVTIPKFTVTLEKTKASEGVKILSDLLMAQRAFFAEHQSYASNLNDLDITITAPDNFNALNDSSVNNNAAEVAKVVRTTGEYTLAINSSGDIACDDAGGTICANLNY